MITATGGEMTQADQVGISIPVTLAEALDPLWLQRALAPISNGAAVTHVEPTGTLETFAAKIRIVVRFDNDDKLHHFCLKGFLDPEIAHRAGMTAVREALFYQRLAPHISMRVPKTIACIDHKQNRAILLMEDLIHAGAHFCSALEPFNAALAARSLDQIARLHAASTLLDDNDWLPSRLQFLATAPHFNAAQLQDIMDTRQQAALSPRTGSASLLLEGMKNLATYFSGSTTTLLHGDCHAGNFYLMDDGPGLADWQLIQRGNWAQDVAYHIAAVLPPDVAEREERGLLAHYLDCVRNHGGTALPLEPAWLQYRIAQIYGFYHWAITTRVEPEIVNVFMQRLGAGIDRHDTYALLGL